MNRRDFFVSLLKTAVAAAAAPTIMKLAGPEMVTVYETWHRVPGVAGGVTTRTFQAMLSEYLSYDMLRDELGRRDFMLQRVERDEVWAGNYTLSWDDEVDT